MECSICLGEVVAPRTTPCGHTFCASCIARVQGAACPLCRAPLVPAQDRGEELLQQLLSAPSEPPQRCPCSVPPGAACFLALWTGLFVASLVFVFAGPSPNASTRAAEGCAISSWLLFAGRVCYGLQQGGAEDRSGGAVTCGLAALFIATCGLAVDGYRRDPADSEAGVVLGAALMAVVGGPSLWHLLATRGRTRAAIWASERLVPRLELGTEADLAESSSLPIAP